MVWTSGGGNRVHGRNPARVICQRDEAGFPSVRYRSLGPILHDVRDGMKVGCT